MITRTTLLELLKTIKPKNITIHIQKQYSQLQTQIINDTNYLPANCKFTERIYHIINELKQRPICLECGKSLHFWNFNDGYGAGYCSCSCANKNKNKQEKTEYVKLLRYGTAKYNNRDKFKLTNLIKYGDEFYNNNSQIKTSLKKKTPKEWVKIKNKQKNTLLKKYGNRNYNNRELMKETKFNRYGDSNFVNVDKMMQTKREKKMSPFGRKMGNYKNFYYESQWELAFIKFCLTNDIQIERNKKGFTYWYQDKKHKYYPDFYLPEVDQYVEIKNGYLLKREKEQEKIKQFVYKLDVYTDERMKDIINTTRRIL
jgi:hypothetical protein